MHFRRFGLIAFLTVVVAATISPASAGQAQPAWPTAQVEPTVWAALRTSPDRQATFVVAMRERVPGNAASTVSAQLALRGSLAALRRTGAVARYVMYYGSNAIMVNGSGAAVRFLASWPEVAEIRLARAGDAAGAARTEVAAAEAPSATGQITGKVTGSDGSTPLPGISITLYRSTGSSSWEVASGTTSAADGAYSFGGLATGFYRVEFQDGTGAYMSEFYDDKADWYDATVIIVIDGQTTPNINAALALAGKISGKVTTQGGSGIGDIRVSAWVSVGGSWQSRGSGTSLSSGTYTIGGLPPGNYRVRFADAYDPARYLPEYYDNVTEIDLATPVSVVAGQTTTGINASLGGYGKMTGKVTAPDGTTGLEDITVDLYQYNPGTGAWDWASFAGSDSSGSYEVPGLVTRDYRVEFSDPLDQYAGEFYTDKATVETGDNVHVELGATTANINASLALKTVTLERALAGDWNLVAVPLALPNPAPGDALAGLGSTLKLVYAYDGCLPAADRWQIYGPPPRPPFANNLTAITVRQGLWLQTYTPATLSVTGVWPMSTSITLCTGWNLIGYPSATPRSVKTALAGIAGKYNLVYAYDAADTADPWKVYGPSLPSYAIDLTTMQPWFGYWIRMTAPATLTIPGR